MSIKQAQQLVGLAMTRLAAATLAPDPVAARLRLGRALIAAKQVDDCGQRWARERVATAVADTQAVFAARGWL